MRFAWEEVDEEKDGEVEGDLVKKTTRQRSKQRKKVNEADEAKRKGKSFFLTWESYDQKSRYIELGENSVSNSSHLLPLLLSNE